MQVQRRVPVTAVCRKPSLLPGRARSLPLHVANLRDIAMVQNTSHSAAGTKLALGCSLFTMLVACSRMLSCTTDRTVYLACISYRLFFGTNRNCADGLAEPGFQCMQ